MSRRRIFVNMPTTGVGAEVKGYGSRDLIEEVSGRASVFNTLTRAWCCRVKTANDVIALAESRGFEVVLGVVA